MKNFTSLNPITITILGLLLFLNITISAQVQNDFTARFNETINGDVTLIANNILSRTATQNYNDEDGNHDFNDNVYVDIDNDNTTFNSSSANFVNPEPQLACLSIRKAYLYWTAADKETSGNDNQPNWNYNDIKLMLPGETSYTTVTADEVLYRGRDFHFSNDPYICFKDITESVIALSSPYGKYQVANIEAKIGGLTSHPTGNAGVSGGWQIAYVYESPELKTRNISLFDGYAHVTKTSNNFDIDFNGFQTVPAGPVNASIIFGALEGDRDLVEDKLQIINTANNYIDLSTPLRDANNFFNSKITVGNADFLDRNPASSNTLGFDAAVFPLDNTNNSIIDNNQTSATIRLTSDQETYGLYLIGLSVEVWSPNLYPIMLSSNAEDNIVNEGDNVIFDFNFANTGNDDAINVVLSTTLPTNLEFVSADNLPNGVTYTYDINTRTLMYYIEDGLVDVGDPLLYLNFELVIKDECYFLEDSCDLSFELQLTATYNGVENPTPKTTLSSSDLDDCQLGTVLPMIINQPPPALWANPPGDLDRTYNCENLNDVTIAQSLVPVPDKCNFTLTKTSGPFVPNNDCSGFSGTYTNTWTFTDACGRTIADYVQVITLLDDSPPVFSSLPLDVAIECTDPIDFEQPTVTDSCSLNIDLSFNDTIINGSCTNNYTITRIWTAIDDCGNTSNASQTITIQDTSAPVFDALPSNNIIACSETPVFTQAIVTDCSAINLTFNDNFTNGSCDGDYSITRTWTAIDECNNTSTASETIYIEDTTAPTLDSPLNAEISLYCDILPDIPNLEFSDNCSSNVQINYDEETIVIDENNYDVIRTWVAYDDCVNENTYTQIIHMQTNNTNTTRALNLCSTDSPINLANYIETTSNGYWSGENLGLLNNTELDPVNIAYGTYTFSYVTPEDRCARVNDIVIEIGDACLEIETCIKSPFDVDISKLVTPNGDLKNQTFNIAYILNSEVDVRLQCDIIVRVKIFNRWGTKVFESDDYDNNWTGTSSGGLGVADKLPAGTYYYVVTLENSGLKPIQGYILLGTEQ